MVDKLHERVAGQKKVRDLTPTKKDLVQAFGEENLKEGKKGWRYDFKKRDGSVDMKKLREFKEMMRPAQRAEANLSLSTQKADVKPERRRGPSVMVPALPWQRERWNLAEVDDDE